MFALFQSDGTIPEEFYNTDKLVCLTFYQILIFLSNGGPLKTMKNVFYFI